MNYKRIYDEIIVNRIANSYVGYTERHHIIPKSLGGSNKKSNLVDLSAREHFICHYLLVKIHKGSNKHKMAKAFNMMNNSSSNQERYINSLLYESQKEAFSKAQSVCQSGTGNSQHGSMWICNIITQKNIKVSKRMPLDDGWVIGRNKWLEVAKIKQKTILRIVNKARRRIKNQKIFENEQNEWKPILEDYLDNDFAFVKEKYNIQSKQSAFVLRLKRYFGDRTHKQK